MKHFYLSVMILSVIIGITACKKDNSDTGSTGETSFPSGLIRTWKAISIDGKQVVTNNTMILQIKDRETANVIERVVHDIPVWQNMHSVISYSNDTLKIIGSVDKPFMRVVQTYRVLELTAERLRVKLVSEVVNNALKTDRMGQEFVFESVASNLNAKIHGMWKTTDTYSEDPFGLYFKTTDDYDYYYYNGGTSTIKNNNEGFYWFYGNFMVLRYKNTPGTNDLQEYVECWNVKIVETTDETNPKTMTFTALHEDGKTETVPFRFLGTF
jgi:hypothetical protein